MPYLQCAETELAIRLVGTQGEIMMVVWYWLLFVFSIGGGLGFLVGTFVAVCRQNSHADGWDGPS